MNKHARILLNICIAILSFTTTIDLFFLWNVGSLFEKWHIVTGVVLLAMTFGLTFSFLWFIAELIITKKEG